MNKMKKATKIVVTLVLVAAVLLAVVSFLWEEREPELKVAVLHFGPIGDYGWTYEAHLGAQAMAEALPYVELSERAEACGPDAPQIMREYAEAGYKVIFCHGWGFGEDIEEIAPDYPDVVFMWGSGIEKKAPNAGIYFARMYEGRFLAGMVAGAMTRTNKIGYAAAIPTSEVVRGIDAFAKGVASVNPDAKVYVEWIGEWYNPPKEKEVTLSLIDKGCDVITHHSDSYAPAEAAEEKGVYFISYHSDMRRFAPHVFLTGVVWNWTPIMTDIVKAVHEGTWNEYPGQDWWYGLAEGGVELAPFSDLVPDDVREKVEEKKQALIEGEFEVFPGMTDEELREIYYFEPNVVGELPEKEAEETIMPKGEERENELKVAVLYCGSISDYGWCREGHLGAKRMAGTLSYVGLSERENACGPDAPQIMRQYADTGYKVIFCHGPEFGEYIEEVAPDYPDVIFMWGDGVEKKAPNAGIYFARMYEGRFLAGMVAGAMTRTNKIGYAAAIPTSEVVRGIDAFAKGVASVNPDAKVYVEWIGEWYNPPKEKEVTLSLIDKGCDVITHHSDSYAPAEAAEEKGVYFISYHSDMRRFAPHVFLTGVVWNWTPIMTDIVKAVHEGTWNEYPGQDWWYGLAEGGVELAPFSDLVPDDVREKVEEKKQALIEGEFEVFPGMTDEELREIYYFEPNVVGELPSPSSRSSSPISPTLV